MEAALVRLYRRWGPRRYVAGYSLFAFTMTLSVGVVLVALFDRYHELSSRDTAAQLGLIMAVAAVSYAWGLKTTRRYWGPLLYWIERPGDADEARVWRAAIDLPRGVVSAVILRLIAVGVPLSSAYLLASLELSVAEVAVAIAGELILIGYAAILNLVLAELVVRPILAEVAEGLPAAVTGGYQGLSIGRKLHWTIPFLAFGCAVVARALGDHSGVTDLAGDIAVAAAIAGTLALAVTIPLVESVRGPIRRLVPATRVVRRGELDVHVPVTATDELGGLTQSFNEMVEALRRNEEELRASRARVVAAADEERRRVERDLHDGAQQQLVLIGLKLAAAERLVERDPPAGAAALRELRRDLDRALAELRELAHGIYPVLLESDGLPGALQQAVERGAIPASLDCDGVRRYPPELEAAVYFCCLEALQNAAKHAGECARAELRLAERDGALVFEVADDGRGFEPPCVEASAGLQNMDDRVCALGGDLQITSTPGHGTTVTGRIPIPS